MVWHSKLDLLLAYGCLLSCRLVPASLQMCVSLTTWVCLLMATAIRHASIGFGPMVVRHPSPPYCSGCIAFQHQSYASQKIVSSLHFLVGRCWGVFRCSLSPQEWCIFHTCTLFPKFQFLFVTYFIVLCGAHVKHCLIYGTLG